MMGGQPPTSWKNHPLCHEGKLLMSLCLPGQKKTSEGDDAEYSAYSFIHFCRSKKLYRIPDSLKS